MKNRIALTFAPEINKQSQSMTPEKPFNIFQETKKRNISHAYNIKSEIAFGTYIVLVFSKRLWENMKI